MLSTHRVCVTSAATAMCMLLARCGGDAGGSGGAVKPAGVTVSTFSAPATGLHGPAGGCATPGSGGVGVFCEPDGIAVDSQGAVFVSDFDNLPPADFNAILKIAPSGTATTLAGSNVAGSADASGSAASFNLPEGLAVDGVGNVYVADAGNNKIRVITPTGGVTTFAGSGVLGSANGPGPAASFSFPTGVAVDAGGNVYVADSGNNLIRAITPAGVVTTLAGSGNAGSANGTGATASFNSPFGVAVGSAGNVYVADSGNNLIRVVASGGVVTTLAGSGAVGSANGPASAASFRFPSDVTVDAAGNLYVADQGNNLIRVITPAGMVSTLAGSGKAGSANGAASAASFSSPFAVAVDRQGNVYVSDAGNNLIRKIAP
jgi:serine/threonine-protein kinase